MLIFHFAFKHLEWTNESLFCIFKYNRHYITIIKVIGLDSSSAVILIPASGQTIHPFINILTSSVSDGKNTDLVGHQPWSGGL